MNQPDIIRLLKATGIFHDISEKVLEDNISHLKIEHFSEGELIFRKGEPGDSLCIVVSGRVSVHDDDYEVAQMGAGDYFGEMSLLSSLVRSMSVSAITPVETLRIDQELFYKMLHDQPAVTRNIIAGLVQRLRSQNNLFIDELKSSEQELRRKVEEQTQLYKEQKERAERSEKFKEQFLANMSHEIRTPMNAVMGMTNILLDKNPREDQLRYLDSIKKSSETLLVIINDILDLSKIEAGKMELEKIDFSLRETLEQVKQTLSFRAEEKGLQLITEVEDSIADVLIGDPFRMNQVLINLGGNAIKFTEKGNVTLAVIVSGAKQSPTNQGGLIRPAESATRNDDVILEFAVSDTGIGIAEEKLQTIFESFTQASGETTRRFGGTGLGLSISKQLIEMQGGKIYVKSEPGKGSTFSFIIQYQVSSNQTLLKRDHKVNTDVIASLKGINILLAEDNEYNRVVAIETLQLKIPDIKIDTAVNGVETLDRLSLNDYDAILMDVQMPVMDGYEATRKIRTEFSPPKNHIPIIALTASVLKSDIDRCLAAGMNSYVPKPFKASDLVLALYKVITKKSGEAGIVSAASEIKTENIASTDTRVTDLTFLKSFCEGDELRMKKYINMYLQSVQINMEKINMALNEKDYGTLQRTVHTMKPHLTYMGMHDVRKLAEIIENSCAKEENLSALPELVMQFDLLCKKSVEELK